MQSDSECDIIIAIRFKLRYLWTGGGKLTFGADKAAEYGRTKHETKTTGETGSADERPIELPHRFHCNYMLYDSCRKAVLYADYQKQFL